MIAELMTTGRAGAGAGTAATADYAERKEKLAELKIKEADILSDLADMGREIAEKERDYAQKEGELARLRASIDQLVAGSYNGHNRVRDFVAPGLGHRQAAVVEGPIATLKKSPGRPKREQIEAMGGNPSQTSLPNLIETWLKDAGKKGMALAELTDKLHELLKSGTYTSVSGKPRSMLDQALFRLKKREKIVRNTENMKFFHADFANQAV